MTDLPIYDEYDVIEHQTIFKDGDWWKAAVLYEGFGNSEVGVYLWKDDGDGNWSRKQKYVVKSASDWEEEREAINSMVNQMDDN